MWRQVSTLLFLMIPAALAGCQKPNEYVAPPPPEVTVGLPVEQMVQEYFETTGQTRAVKVVELRARVTGYLQSIEFRDGDFVEAGQVLYRIDPAIYEAAVESAEAALEKATAQHLLAEQNLKRAKQLISQQVVTESELDVRQAELDSAKADVSAAQASLRNAKLNLSYTEITAPFAGRIGHHMVDVGNLIQTGETALARIETVDPIHAYFTISESDVLRFQQMVREGKVVYKENEPLVTELALGDSRDYQFQGQLDYSEFGVDPLTGTTQRRAVFDNKSGDLLPGLFVRARAAVGEPMKKLLVADQAIGSDQRGEYVLIVGSDNKVIYRPVKTGIYLEGLRVIESGVAATDQIVVIGLQRARPGSEVDIGTGPKDMRDLVHGADTSADEVQSEENSEEKPAEEQAPEQPAPAAEKQESASPASE